MSRPTDRNSDEDADEFRLPSHYAGNDGDARRRRLWGTGGAREEVDPDDRVGGLPPLPDHMREEGKNNGRRPESDSVDLVAVRRRRRWRR